MHGAPRTRPFHTVAVAATVVERTRRAVALLLIAVVVATTLTACFGRSGILSRAGDGPAAHVFATMPGPSRESPDRAPPLRRCAFAVFLAAAEVSGQPAFAAAPASHPRPGDEARPATRVDAPLERPPRDHA